MTVFLFAKHTIDGEDYIFQSNSPFSPNGCNKCGKFKDENYETQADNMKIVGGQVLCVECQGNRKPSKTVQMCHYIQMLRQAGNTGTMFR